MKKVARGERGVRVDVKRRIEFMATMPKKEVRGPVRGWGWVRVQGGGSGVNVDVNEELKQL